MKPVIYSENPSLNEGDAFVDSTFTPPISGLYFGMLRLGTWQQTSSSLLSVYRGVDQPGDVFLSTALDGESGYDYFKLRAVIHNYILLGYNLLRVGLKG